MPGVRCSGRKGGSREPWIREFAQVDSVLSADGRRPVRRGQYTAGANCQYKRLKGPDCSSYFFGALPSRPPWLRMRYVTAPLSFLKNSTSASTTFRKNFVSDSAKSGNLLCPVACVINW